MNKELKRILIIVLLVSLLLPLTVFGYDFENKEQELNARRTKEEIYDLYNLYKFVVGTKTSADFGLIGYNGQCSQVTVDGKVISLEDYVAGVVKAESGSESDNPELLKAQAIAARSFVVGGHQNSSSCNVTNGESYQAYRSIDHNSAADRPYIQAAAATQGMVVSRNGKVAVTQYLSYPNEVFYTEDSSGWHVQFQRFGDDPSTAWVWNGPSKATVLAGNNWASNHGAPSTTHHFGMSQTIAGYLSRREGYSYDKLIKLFYGEDVVKLSDGVYDDKLSYVDSEFGKIYYWNQGDYPNYYYSESPTTKNTYGGTIKSHGCGPTSVAIVASSMLQKSISPIETTQKVCQAGGCTTGGSYNGTLGQVLQQSYGLKVSSTSNNQQVLNALGTGKSLVIVLMGPGTFTTGGHYIVLTGVNKNGQVSVADPASRDRTNKKWFSFNTIIEQRKTYATYTIVTKA